MYTCANSMKFYKLKLIILGDFRQKYAEYLKKKYCTQGFC